MSAMATSAVNLAPRGEYARPVASRASFPLISFSRSRIGGGAQLLICGADWMGRAAFGGPRPGRTVLDRASSWLPRKKLISVGSREGILRPLRRDCVLPASGT